MTWLRLYADLPDHPEIQSLPAEIFRTLINCWCIAAGGGGRLPDVAVLAWRIRMPAHSLSDHLEELQRVGLLTKDADGLAVKNWEKRQFVSDNSTPRVQRFRDSQRAIQRHTANHASPETERNVSPETVCSAPEQNIADTDQTPYSPPMGDGRDVQENQRPNAASTPEREVSIPPRLRRMGSWFKRRDTTPYGDKERAAYKKHAVGKLDEEDVSILEQYYLAQIAPDEDNRRHDLVTLLNNWSGELDRARRWASKTSPSRPVSDELELVL